MEDGHKVAQALRHLSDTNLHLDLPEEGIQQAKEALEILERIGDTVQQTDCLIKLAWSLGSDKQFDAAEAAAFRAIDLLPEKGNQFRICESHHILGEIYHFKGETGKAIHHFEIALGIAFSFDWHDRLFWIHCNLAWLFLDERRFDDAQAHVEHAKSRAVNSTYYLGYVTEEQAWV